MPRTVWVVLILLALLLAGCSAQGQLGSRAAQYYSFMAGHNPKMQLSSFYSPAYRGLFKRDALKQMDSAIKPGAQAGGRYPEAKPSDVAVNVQGRFALTTANPGLGTVYATQDATKWVHVGLRWYLYLGSQAEVKAYGPFPVGMKRPQYKPAS